MTLRTLPLALCLAPLVLAACENPPDEVPTVLQPLVDVVAEAPGANCEGGGQAVRLGFDDDGNGTLGAEEIDTTTYVCDGADGADGAAGQDGAAGADGQDGANGQDGVDGQDGTSTLLSLSTLPPDDERCPGGGTLIEAGADVDGSGTLDAGEVTSTEVVCDGAAGADGEDGAPGQDGAAGSNSLITLTTEPPGENCGLGGLRVDSGVDDDGDGYLSLGEHDDTAYVCAAGCGDGVVQGGEACDVGIDNGGEGSGCSLDCTLTCEAPLHGASQVSKTREGEVCWIRFDGWADYRYEDVRIAKCASLGGYPARVLSSAEDAQMAALTTDPFDPSAFWIGLRYGVDGWMWSNGYAAPEPVSGYTNWGPDQPQPGSECGLYLGLPGMGSYWASGPCDVEESFPFDGGVVCEVPLF